SGEKATDLIQDECPLNGPAITLPVFASHTRKVQSCEPEATYWPSGEKATALTALVCPSKGPAATSPVFASHTHTVWSYDPEAISWPSGENATDETRSLWPSSTFRTAGQSVTLPKMMARCCGICDRNSLKVLVSMGAS